jgi:hypothetical protein
MSGAGVHVSVTRTAVSSFARVTESVWRATSIVDLADIFTDLPAGTAGSPTVVLIPSTALSVSYADAAATVSVPSGAWIIAGETPGSRTTAITGRFSVAAGASLTLRDIGLVAPTTGASAVLSASGVGATIELADVSIDISTAMDAISIGIGSSLTARGQVRIHMVGSADDAAPVYGITSRGIVTQPNGLLAIENTGGAAGCIGIQALPSANPTLGGNIACRGAVEIPSCLEVVGDPAVDAIYFVQSVKMDTLTVVPGAGTGTVGDGADPIIAPIRTVEGELTPIQVLTLRVRASDAVSTTVPIVASLDAARTASQVGDSFNGPLELASISTPPRTYGTNFITGNGVTNRVAGAGDDVYILSTRNTP